MKKHDRFFEVENAYNVLTVYFFDILKTVLVTQLQLDSLASMPYKIKVM